MAVSSTTVASGKTSQAKTIAALKRQIARRGKRIERLKSAMEEEREEKERGQRRAKKLEEENKLLTAQLQANNQEAAPNNLTLERFCSERGIANHTFGARMIALCVNLAKHLSFGAVPTVLSLVFEALGLEIKVPSHDSVKHWCKRVGLSHLKHKETVQRLALDC